MSNMLAIVKILVKSKDSKLKRISYIIKGCFLGMFFNPKIEYVK